jgi:predicted XRE-type DNA-binding protein
MSTTGELDYTEGSGNVFADLGLADPEEALAKAELARAIGAAITERQLTQTQAATLLGIDQPKVSALMRGRLSGFSIDRLLRFLVALDRDVEIIVKPHSSSGSRVTVVAMP